MLEQINKIDDENFDNNNCKTIYFTPCKNCNRPCDNCEYKYRIIAIEQLKDEEQHFSIGEY